jgi:hypothetical protein
MRDRLVMEHLDKSKPGRILRDVAALFAAMIFVAGCSSGSDSSSPPPPVNQPPIANAGPDQSADEGAGVTLTGTGADTDGNVASYSWGQDSGTAVTITGAGTQNASFTAPMVSASESLVFRLTITDNAGATGSDTVTITVNDTSPPPNSVTVSGTAAYEFVPPNDVCQGLDFNSITVRPIRGATVQLLDSSSGVLDTTTSDDNGAYSFAGVAPNTMVRVRVRAELKRAGSPGWDVEVRDNVDTSATPPPLGARPLYTVSGSQFDTGTANVTHNLTAQTGWNGSSYTGARAAAPFAILDTIYSAMRFVISVDATATFAPLDAFWSVNNTLASPSDIDAGDLGASFYRSDLDSLFLLGDAAVDTEEFDDHVIVHEWGHYFEDNFSRSDSVGGPHGVGDQLDARLAFGEGWATALSGMALNDPIYCDTGPAGSTGGFGIGTEQGAYDAQGWYDEISVVRFIYDLWDDNDEGTNADTGSIGFGPIYDVMVGPQAFTETFTTIFSFAAELRATLPPADQAFLDSQLVREDMTPGFDKWGVGELNDASPAGQQSRDVLPLYVDLPTDGSVINICANDDYDGSGDGNKLAVYRYLRINLPGTAQYDVNITTTTTGALPPDDPTDPRDQSDPDMFIFRDGLLAVFGNSGDANEEIFRTPVLSGPDIYVADLREFRYADPDSPLGFPDQMCFDVSFTPVP